ncbi:MAG: (4Fe-4S)-binding protein, partial [Acidobacteriota bacterium]|nr:(4Fe-4S)-binding protein [Acidobacteriota bacterium]
MKSQVRHYRGNQASVTFDTHRCIHSEVCVRGLPQVFDVSRRPWILPDEADPKRLERVVLGCPTGALRMAPPTDQKVEKGVAAAATVLPEEPRKKSSASITPDGPYYVRGNLEIEETPG